MRARRSFPLAPALGFGLVLFGTGCPGPATVTDAGPGDDANIRPTDAGHDTGPAVPVSTDHCEYLPVTPSAHVGANVAEGPLSAGASEGYIHTPVGATLGAYTGRAEGFGGEGFIDARRTDLAFSFASSVGIEAWPRVRALALTTGCGGTPIDTEACDETIIIIKADLGGAYHGLGEEVERRLGAEFAGRTIISTSHSHSAFANHTGHAGLQVGFGQFRRLVFEAVVADMERVARAALAARVPAQIGIMHDGAFDMDDRVQRDRRGEDDALQGGPRDDHDLFLIRVDTFDPAAPTAPSEPIAILPVFGMHGTILGADNVYASSDAPGGIERVLEERFDSQVAVMHLQGAGGDVSPAGLDATECPSGAVLCKDFARAETVGLNAADALLAAWATAGAAMRSSVSIDMVSASIDRGPDWNNFVVRDGTMSYLPWDGIRPADGRVYEGSTLIAPIDEFNAPQGAALCGGSDLTIAIIPSSQMPGTRTLTDYPYSACNMLNPGFLGLIAAQLDLDLGPGTPPCDTTRTLVSAFRIDDWYFSALPGEPLTLSADRIRELTSAQVPEDHHVVLGYAQDHQGYILTAEDWLSGGYEPSITFWGPLDGEQILERTADLFDLLATPEREPGATGQTRVAIPSPTEAFTPDPAPMMGTVPAAVPAYLATRLLPAMPESMQPPATLRRLESAFFSFIGEDPLAGTPEVTIEHEVSTDVWEPLRRRSGRVISDADVLISWTPNPLNHEGGERTHYWSVEWQAVPGLGQPGFEAVTDRAGLPLGRYRIVVEGPDYALVSSPFTVGPGNIEIARTGGTGTSVELSLGYHAPGGYRLLDEQTGATRLAPIRGGTVDVVVTAGAGVTRNVDDVVVGADGHATFDAGAGAVSVEVTDRFGNVGTFTL